ncbi:GNAT family N-acetyltransferase [Curtobacterium oceanosedimentum]|uniref:GNAT family N-acetyltransferase n=1 Tax=Curtobacterium oceanosedimentum TaxID=465820 RepID=UPI001CE1ECA5|nr:GNAT family N-acetyltransferase [Curtobacterium oceanosedimentum]MCA5924423.1 GNAT family N-acetyltransferase [Curtobacterium oceanosedimentum]
MTDTRLVAMPATRLPAWLDRTMTEYVASRMQAGENREQAEANAQATRDRWFPGGTPAAGHLVWDVVDQDDTVVGYLWVGPFEPDSTAWWVFDVEIDDAHRRRGHARRALEAGERAAADHGATSIGLNVFGYNTGAQELYASLGYGVTATQMRKALA